MQHKIEEMHPEMSYTWNLLADSMTAHELVETEESPIRNRNQKRETQAVTEQNETNEP
jgi:hypothetical protein